MGRRWRRYNVGFNVTNGEVGLVSKKFSKATMTKSTGEVVEFLPASTAVDPRRQLGRRGNGDSDQQFPTAIVELEQTTVNADGESVQIMVQVSCRAMYRKKRGEDCTLKGLNCHDGEYSYWSTDDGAEEADEEDEWFLGMKCIAPEDGQYWKSDWDECAVTEA